MDQAKIKFNRLWIGIPITIIIAGLLSIVFLIIGFVKGSEKDTSRIVVPGEQAINLTKPGAYTIFYEFRSIVNGKSYITESNLVGLRCALVNISSGKEVLLLEPSGYTHYNNWAREGTSVLEFKIKKTGKYQFAGWYEKGKTGEKVVLAISPENGRSFILIFECIGIFIAMVGVSVLMAIRMTSQRNPA